MSVYYYRRVSRVAPVYFCGLMLFMLVFFPNGLFPVEYVRSEFELELLNTFFKNETRFPSGCDQNSMIGNLFVGYDAHARHISVLNMTMKLEDQWREYMFVSLIHICG